MTASKVESHPPLRGYSRTPVGEKQLGPTILLLLGILVHLLFLVSLRTGWLAPLFEDTRHRFGPGCDFFSIYAAGVKARASESIYTIGGHVQTVPYAYAFRYAPFVAYTLGLALSLLPAISSYALWLILCELALLRNIRLTWERAPDTRTGLVCAAMWLLFTPYFLELYVGQFTFLTASLVFWAWLAWHTGGRKERRLGDGFWAVAVWLKMMPLLFLPLVLLRGRWKAALVVPLLLALGSGLYFARFPADWAVFTDTNLSALPTFHAGNQGLMALLYAAVGEQADAYRIARWGVLALVGTALAWLTWRAWRVVGTPDAERRLLYLYAALSAAYLLTYKDVWEHHFVLLLPPLVLLALRKENRLLWLPPFIVCALPSLFALYDLPHLGYNEEPQPYWSHAVSLIQHGWKPLAPLWLMGGLLAMNLRETNIGAWLREQGARLRPARPVMQTVAVILLGVGLFGTARWVRVSITGQRQVTQAVAWPASVFQKQQHDNTCGPAALAAVCRHYGVGVTEDEIARLAGTTASGTSMLGLQRAAESEGLVTQAWQMSPEGLRHAPWPCILFFHAGHFAVLTGVVGDHFYLADPSLGQHAWTESELAQNWRGEVLAVGPSEELKARQRH